MTMSLVCLQYALRANIVVNISTGPKYTPYMHIAGTSCEEIQMAA